ncbi:MAG: hypothetical protein U0452_06645 [Anaerolineae bacterium]
MANGEPAASDVQVRIDDRARLVGALLAATRYPELAQARKKHGVHAHARATRKRLAPLGDHPAAQAADALLTQGMSVEALFALAFTLNPVTLRPAVPLAGLPPALADGLPDFAQQADLAAWWQEESEPWQRAHDESVRALNDAQVGPFLDGFFGPTAARLLFMPNIGYPEDAEIALAAEGALIAVIPPRPAWGDSPPWPFDEDQAHVLRAAIVAYSRLRLTDALLAHPDSISEAAAGPLPVSETFRALYPAWTDQFAQIFGGALVAIYLDEWVHPKEASAYLLIEKHVRGLDILPAAVNILQSYRGQKGAGSSRGLAAFLPRFPALLRDAAPTH